MNTYFLELAATSVLLLPSLVLAEDSTNEPDKCMVVVKEERGVHCNNNPDSLALTIQNQCDQALDLKYTLDRTDGKSSSGVVFSVKPSATVDSAWTCSSTGKYRIFGRTTGSSAPFPDDKGVYRKDGATTYALAYGESPESACARVKLWGSGRCECELPQLGNPIYRCRATVSGAATQPTEEQTKPFPANQFFTAKTTPPARGMSRQEIKITGSTMEVACGAARATLTTPESSCVCIPASKQAICSMTGLIPEGNAENMSLLIQRKAREYIKAKFQCGQLNQPECDYSMIFSVALGVRG